MSFNLSGTVNAFRLLFNPALCLPHATVSTFNDLPVPLSRAFAQPDKVDIRAVVLDKDNCFAVPQKTDVFEAYKERFKQLRDAYPGKRLLIVSNSAGTLTDRMGEEARLLEQSTGVPVLNHTTKKPGCGAEVLQYFRDQADCQVTSPAQVAVIGDRLFTDAMLANMMGARAIWIKDGVMPDNSIFVRMEKSLQSFLLKRGYAAPDPRSTFE